MLQDSSTPLPHCPGGSAAAACCTLRGELLTAQYHVNGARGLNAADLVNALQGNRQQQDEVAVELTW